MFVYTPKACLPSVDKKGEEIPALFSGHIVLRPPGYEERLELLASNPDLINFINDDNKEKAKKEKEKHGKKEKEKEEEFDELSIEQVRVIAAQVKWSYGYYEKVDLVRAKDGKHFKDLQSLRSDRTCNSILQEIAVLLSGGLELGNE